MKSIQSSEAKTHLLRLLDEVERGETIVITRRGTPIARLVPEEGDRQQRVRETFRQIAELRKDAKLVTVNEILAWRHEGHRF